MSDLCSLHLSLNSLPVIPVYVSTWLVSVVAHPCWTKYCLNLGFNGKNECLMIFTSLLPDECDTQISHQIYWVKSTTAQNTIITYCPGLKR